MLAVMDRHIGRTVLGTTMMVLIAFLGLMTIFALIDELGGSRESYGFGEALTYVALTTPRRIYEMLPYMVFLGALIGLGSLASNSEIVVLRAAGVSVWRVFVSVALPAFIVLLLGFLLGEFVAPRGEELAEAHKTRSRQDSEVIVLRGGYWYREANLYMNVDGLDGQGGLIGLRQFWLDDDEKLVRSVSASRAEYVSGADPHWMLFDVVETVFQDEATNVQRSESVRWDGNVDPRLLGVRVLVEPRKLSVTDLSYQIDYMTREGLNAGSYQLAYWGKLMQPLSVLGLALLALCFVLGPLREVGMGVRLSVGVIAGLSFKYLQDLFAPMSYVYDLPPPLAVALPIIFCWAIGLVGLRRVA